MSATLTVVPLLAVAVAPWTTLGLLTWTLPRSLISVGVRLTRLTRRLLRRPSRR